MKEQSWSVMKSATLILLLGNKPELTQQTSFPADMFRIVYETLEDVLISPPTLFIPENDCQGCKNVMHHSKYL